MTTIASGQVSGGQGGQQNLNTSFSALNNSLSQKWALINSGNKKVGGLTGRQQMHQSTSNLAQTLTPGYNQLNSSTNKFQSKIGGGGGFASRLQSKQTPGGAAAKEETGIIG